jgi:hypothetical protein
MVVAQNFVTCQFHTNEMFITSPLISSEPPPVRETTPNRNRYEQPKRDPTQVLGQQHIQQLCELLTRSLSPHPQIQKPAEETLHEIERKNGFPSLLLVRNGFSLLNIVEYNQHKTVRF